MNAPDSSITLRAAIRAAHRQDEAQAVSALLAEVQALPLDRAAARAQAAVLVADLRRNQQRHPGVAALMQEFPLSSQEGVALMCLAESLLRVPDAATADALIHDKLARQDWAAHLHRGGPPVVQGAAWGLLLGGRLLRAGEASGPRHALGRLLARGGEPLVRRALTRAMRQLGQHFVMGEDIAAALRRAEALDRRGYTCSFDMLGEAALTRADARRYLASYEAAIDAVGRHCAGRGLHDSHGISVKLSALHPRYERSQRGRVLQELLPPLRQLIGKASAWNIGVTIDAEESERLELSLDLLAALAAEPWPDGWEGLGWVVQAYQKRAPQVVDYIVELARRHGRRMMLRLVKGAYWDGEIKRAQQRGLDGYPVFTRRAHTDLCYLACAGRMLQAPDALHPQFATHNALTLASIRQMARALARPTPEFQCLHGMGEALYDNLSGHGPGLLPCRIYAPVGPHRHLLPYLVRRLLENGANSSFVHRIADPAYPAEQLLQDPVEHAAASGGSSSLSLPPQLFGSARDNARGLDLHDEDVLSRLEQTLAAAPPRQWQAAPLLAGQSARAGKERLLRNPARQEQVIGWVREADSADIEHALAAATAAAPVWHAVPVAMRSRLLRAAARQLEDNCLDLMELCCREAGKTLPNALAEVREAVDFCHYYAAQAESLGAGPPLGPVLAISPWNFPLAILVGQVVAALAAGRVVIAKPADQTPLCAALAVRLLHQAGIPAEALQLLPGRGDTVGAALVADPRVHAVLFTGSLATAQQIQRQLRGHGQELVAETGGVNVMIADASTLPEQLIRDVLVSAFDSAGQRCSALRVLCLQDEIADSVIPQLREAMAELLPGDPALLATDLGPVIDESARRAIETHVARMAAAGHPVWRAPLPAACEGRNFVAPTLIEIRHYSDVAREVFGPVLHVLRYRHEALEPLLESINASGYRLTLGIHSRIGRRTDQLARSTRVGNVYINRSMIGAVVGVQPFGGSSLSGTGPKAGGPLYLPRLMKLPAVGCGAPALPEATLQALSGFAAWAESSGRSALAASCQAYRQDSLYGRELALPGSTGESNRLRFRSLGPVLCVADSVDGLLLQIAAACATGNTAIVDACDPAAAIIAQLPAPTRERCRVIPTAASAPIHALLCACSPEKTRWLRHALAAREGPIIPLLQPDPQGRYPLERLVAEQTICEDTTASGGNPQLLSETGE